MNKEELYRNALLEIDWLVKDFTMSQKEVLHKIGKVVADTKENAEKLREKEAKNRKHDRPF